MDLLHQLPVRWGCSRPRSANSEAGLQTGQTCRKIAPCGLGWVRAVHRIDN